MKGLSSAFNNNGIAVADYDKDHDLDIFVVTRWGKENNGPVTSNLYRNNNDGSFTDVTSSSGINSTHDYTGEQTISGITTGFNTSASWGDYDNDGFPDLFLSSANRIELYHNEGDGTFKNVTTEAGIPTSITCHYTGASWFDFNNDSFLDIYVSKLFACSEGSLYRNNGDGTFSEISQEVGLKESGKDSWMSIPWDINDDGFQDLYIVHDFGGANECYLNLAGVSFVDSAEHFGITDIFRDGMGMSLADFNNDEKLDFYVTNIDESSLYKNLGDGAFENVAEALGVDTTDWSWGTQFEDFDHDLDVDLVVLNGYYNAENKNITLKYSNIYFENLLETGHEQFINRASNFGMDEPSYSNALAAFDYDNDGDLDILISRTGDQLEFFENQTIENGDTLSKNWAQFFLEGTTSNRDAIGSRVKIKVGGNTLVRYYHGVSLMAQNLQPLHFGLLDAEVIDELNIKWPSGLSESYYGLPVNSFLHIKEGVGYDTLTLESHKVLGCTDPNSCSYDPQATLNDGSCTYLEAHAIVGPKKASALSEAMYSYSGTEGNQYEWSVVNGEIVDGQGEASITVRWDIAESGSVSVTESGSCKSLPVSLEIELAANKNMSVARMWNEALLAAIRKDYARPTVHARNLFHTSVAMYDAWAIFDDHADTYLIGKQLHNYFNDFEGFDTEVDDSTAVRIAISYAAYRLLTHRFSKSPNHANTQKRFDELMALLGLDISYISTNYTNGNPAALGNFIGQSLIEYGHLDKANEENGYANKYYQPRNTPLVPALPGNPSIEDPNHWQPLTLNVFIDQAGNVIDGKTPGFLSPEWGNVHPFSLRDSESQTFTRDGNDYVVYHDPGSPPQLNGATIIDSNIDIYKWNFLLVSMWSSHLNPYDGVQWDISPKGIGNIDFGQLPDRLENHSQFYDLFNGGDIGKGRAINPITGQPYSPQIVPRGDYTRVLAEFWADGPDSETPPGHWFVLLNYVNDHPEFVHKFKGEGEVLNPLEWDVKAYFILGGTMHDAAVAAWAVKGWYDFIRPISAIRYMADQGQSTIDSLGNYSPNGIPLVDGFVEIVEEGDLLAGENNENVGKIKLYAWKGHDYVDNPSIDEAGVGWILAENWWPYQRPSFVTPPFAGFVSGHSTYSRAGAEVMTLLTGSEYFPGGMGEFLARENEFLVFEEGPSQDVVLQWATYRDASDQCSLSRIWGGIHPPADDIPGRLMGAKIGKEAFEFAESFFNRFVTGTHEIREENLVYPVPVTGNQLHIMNTKPSQEFVIYNLLGRQVAVKGLEYIPDTKTTTIVLSDTLKEGVYIIESGMKVWKIVVK